MRLNDLIEEHYNELNQNDFYIWQYILRHGSRVQDMSMYELSEQCNISHTSIVRFAKKLGLSGFSELKLCLKLDARTKKVFDRNKVSVMLNEYHDVMNDLFYRDVDEILEEIYKAKRVHIYATGEAQHLVAQEMKREFIQGGKMMFVVDGTAEVDFLLRQEEKNMFFILISQFGENETENMIAEKLQACGIRSLSISLNNRSLLSQYTNYHIGYKTTGFSIESSDEDYYCSMPLFLISHMLFIRYMEYLYYKEG